MDTGIDDLFDLQIRYVKDLEEKVKKLEEEKFLLRKENVILKAVSIKKTENFSEKKN